MSMRKWVYLARSFAASSGVITGGEGTAEGAATEGGGVFERLWSVLRVCDPGLKNLFSRLANLDSEATKGGVFEWLSAISIINAVDNSKEGYIIMSSKRRPRKVDRWSLVPSFLFLFQAALPMMLLPEIVNRVYSFNQGCYYPMSIFGGSISLGCRKGVGRITFDYLQNLCADPVHIIFPFR